MRVCSAVAAVLLAGVTLAAHAQPAWHDESPHRAHYLRVNGARLHYLDWGGRGPLLLLIHGWGSNAHVFDDLAPRLTGTYHVVALTLRGFGESDTVPGNYTLARYADDVRATLDSLHAKQSVFAAHSFGGWVLTDLARRYASRVSEAVYLDAAFDMHVSDSIVARRPLKRPPLLNPRTREDVTRWLAADFFGMWTPALEAEYRARPDDEEARAAQLKRVAAEAERASPDWASLPVKAMAICALATTESEFPWLTPASPDYARAKGYVEDERRPRQHAECERFRTSRPGRQTVELPGHHYVFVAHPDEVARAVLGLRLPNAQSSAGREVQEAAGLRD